MLRLKILSLFFLGLMTSVSAQSIREIAKLQWYEPIKDARSNVETLNFSNGQFINGEMKYFYVKRLNHLAENISIQVQEKNTSPLPANQSKLLKGKPLKSGISYVDMSGVEAGKTVIRLAIDPVVMKNGLVHKVESFDIDINYKKKSRQYTKAATTDKSVLSEGDWYKMGVLKDGVYKLTYNQLVDMGVGVASIDPKTIQLYGIGGGMLTEDNSVPYSNDLDELAIQVVGEEDGVFNAGDYVLFYGQGPIKWTPKNGVFEHQQNIYSDTTFYFLTVGQQAGKRIENQTDVAGSPDEIITSFDDYAVFENEDRNLVKCGRSWFGEYYDIQSSYNAAFNFPNIDKSAKVLIEGRFAARSTSQSSLRFRYGTSEVLELTSNSVSLGNYADYYKTRKDTNSFVANGDNIVIISTFDKNGNPSAIAWLDYIRLQVRRSLIFDNVPMFFRDLRSLDSGKIYQYDVQGVSEGTTIWDVTQHSSVARVAYTLNGSSASFKSESGILREYVCFKTSGLLSPKFVKKIENQNLHELKDVNYIVITPRAFKEPADSLLAFHVRNSGVSGAVVVIDDIYNEFSGGAQDLMGIRRFLRHLYYGASNEAGLPKNIMLFGDASYDFKNRVKINHNKIPIYQSELSNNLNKSTVNDDAIAFLDSNETVNFSADLLDVGVSRVPINTVQEAEAIVVKVKQYASTSSFGNWRNKILFATDDVDDDWEDGFMYEAERNAEFLQSRFPWFNVDKIYADAYTQIATAAGQRYPDVRDGINRKVNDGVLLFNYIGHGGELGLSEERLLEVQDVINWTNKDKLAVFVTATCEFTRIDDPDRVSAGEYLILNQNGGSIASFSTTRTVFAQTAYSINRGFYDNIFEGDGTFGQIMMRTKNDSPINEYSKFSLFGDAGSAWALPTYNIKTNSVKVDDGDSDTLKALSLVTIEGEVIDDNMQLLSDYEGVIFPTVYDKPVVSSTLNNDNLSRDQAVYPEFDFATLKNVLYKGKSEVKDGKFTFSFVMPKDIAYSIGKGKVSYYAFNENFDAKGFDSTLFIGGASVNALEDEVGPQIELFMNDEQFVIGGITDENPSLYALVTDSTGINTVGNGIGHDIVAVLDQDQQNGVVLNEYYESDLNSYQSGKIVYPFKDLKPGRHTLDLKVWDVFNNSSQARTEFIVAETADMALDHVLNYPNPFTSYTEFHFEHNRPGEDLQLQVQVFTVSGKLVKTINKDINSIGYRVTEVSWDGRDDYGDLIGKGVYVYKVKVRSKLDNSVAEKYEKLVILR